MALWQSGQITNINTGVSPNDGNGDSIRNAFLKVDDNFGNISSFLSGTTVGFLNANITNALTSNYSTFANTFTTNATGVNSNFTSNAAAGNLIANTGLYSTGTTVLRGDTYITGNIVPTVATTYDLGSAANPFRAIYYQTAYTGGTVQTTDAGQLVVHGNTTPGDVKDVGILGNISHHYSSNTYAYFGYQYQTNNFIYKITNVDPTRGNSVVYSGIYGNTQFGSQFLSNTTTSTSSSTGALIVAGGAGIAGNVNTDGNIVAVGTLTAANVYSGGFQVITADTLGYYGTPLVGGIVGGSSRFTSSEASTTANTGAIAIPYGGLGVAGNVFSTSGFYGNITGNILTPAQPLITTVGSLNGLTISPGYNINTPDLQATTIGVTGITASTLTVTGALTGLTSLTLSGNVTSNTAGFVGSLYGTVQTAAQTRITSLGALTSLAVDGGLRSGITVANSFSTANAVISGGYINALANLSATQATFTNFATGNAVISGGYLSGLANISVTSSSVTNQSSTTDVATNFSTGNAQITGGTITGLTNLASTTSVATNFSTGNARITGGYINTLANLSATQATITNFATGNAVISGGYLSGLANISATNSSSTTQVATNFSTANALITGGNITGLANAHSINAYFSSVSTGTISVTGGSLTGLTTLAVTSGNITNLTSSNAQVTGGNITGITNISSTTEVATNFSTGNARITGGYINSVANIYATTGVVTNFSTGNAVIAGGYASGLANIGVTTGYIGTIYASTLNATTIGNTGASIVGTISTAAQTSITSVGTLTNLQTTSLGVGTAATGTSGEIRATNNITAYYSSDAKFKDNVVPVTDALSIVTAIGSKLFDWNNDYIADHGGEDGYFVQKSDFGVIAQDVLKVFPRAVRTRPDGSLAVDYEKLGTLAFGAVEQLLKRVEALESAMDQLKK